MKKIVGISLFVFLAAVTAILLTGFIFSQKTPVGPDPASLLPSSSGSIVLSAQEIGKHSLESDCWMIIDGKVYNFTSYLNQHPGRASTMIPYCGKDGSQGFATKDLQNPQSHSSFARNLFVSYYLGDLNQTINQSIILTPSQPLTPDNGAANVSPALSAPSASIDASVTLNNAEIIKHNSAKDCWLIINSKIYNVTNYLGAHPGGINAIAPYCGKDAAQAFQGLPHSSYANSLLANYYIGNLNQVASTRQIQQNVQNTAQTTPLPGRGGDEESDD